jgi:hypothetical protein
MRVPVKPLAECSDPASLSCAIQELCAERGIAAHVDIWTLARSGKRQALCFVRTDPAVEEQRLAGTPGFTRFGKELLFIVELPPEAPKAKRSAERTADGVQRSLDRFETSPAMRALKMETRPTSTAATIAAATPSTA